MFKALSVREPQPACADVEALSETPVETLLELIDKAQQPPWVGMRAASCLIQGHADAVQDTLVDWVQQEDSRGFAILVLNQIDTLPQPVAIAVATQALAGPYASDATSRIAKSTNPALLALVP